MTDAGPPGDDPLWRQFEHHVATLLEAYEGASVRWNHHVTGRKSNISRQVDVWVEGQVAGEPMSIAVECRRYSKKMGIGAVDQFSGFLDDVGANKGVLYTTTELTAGARSRATGENSRMRIVEMVAHEPSVDEYRRFLFEDCPACTWGEILWNPHVDSLDGSEQGTCGRCGSTFVKCGNCNSIADMVWDEIECDGCGVAWSAIYDSDYAEVQELKVTREGS